MDDTSHESEFDAPVVETATPTAKQRLRAFEDRVLGEDATRIDDKVERGHGSRFKEMTADQHREYAALERLVGAEQKLADASAALAKAEGDHQAALAAVAVTESKSDGGDEQQSE